MKKSIELVPYNPEWVHMFKDEANLIKEAVNDNFLNIHHIGSTSIPGLCSKPIIDIILIMKNPMLARHQLEKIDFQYGGEYNIPLRYFFKKRSSTNVNLHVYEMHHPEINLNLAFRDYLIANEKIKNEYADIKKKILAENDSCLQKENSLFKNYTLRKGDFIRSVLKKTGFNLPRILKCSDDTEWSVAKNFRNQYFIDNNIDKSNLQFLENEDNVHIVLYKGSEIVGYSNVQFKKDTEPQIPIFIIDKNKCNNICANNFMLLINKWIDQLKINNNMLV